MRNLFKNLGRYKLESVLGPLFKLLEAMFELFVPLVVADIVDRGIAEGDRPRCEKVSIITSPVFHS